jgi:transcriptional regulator with XRE-family HTH domain
MTPKQLKEWRKKTGFSQVRLARLLGVDVMTVSRWERGIRQSIPPYLHITLECIEKKEVEPATKEKPKKERR